VLQRPLELAQYGSWAFTERARTSGLIPSMGSVGDCYDNGLMEMLLSLSSRHRRCLEEAEEVPGVAPFEAAHGLAF
jgi:transposase InsO family protein